MGAKLPDISTLIKMGINPKTGLPIKMGDLDGSELKDNTKRFLKLIDEQTAINRYKWYNLPCNLSSQELERLIYHRGQLAFFYMENLDEFYFMPYALEGTLDFYGRYNSIHPVPICSQGDREAVEAQAKYLSTIKLKCQYGVLLEEEVDYDTFTHSAVILRDYSTGFGGQEVLPRTDVNDSLIDCMADCVPYMKTALLNATGVHGIRVSDADQAESVIEASKSVDTAAKQGNLYVPMLGATEFQEVTSGNTSKPEEFMLALQSLDNLRLSGYGLDNSGVFNKKAHTLQSEQEMNTANVELVYQDGLTIRQNFCNIVNSIWGLNIWCEPSESVLGIDQDLDGKAYDSNEGEHSGSKIGGTDNNEQDDA